MIRHAAAVAVVLCLSPSWVYAQSTELTVKLASANVHKGPSTGSPVIGKAPRGAVLEVTRELGDWVKVTWTETPDSAGYVHLSAGSLAPLGSSASASTRSQAVTSSGRQPAPANLSSEPRLSRVASVDPEPIVTHQHVAPAPAGYVRPPTHVVGLGGQVSGSTLGVGGSARAWARNRLGLQMEVSRYALTNPAVPGRVTSIALAPSVLYSLPDRVTDYFWLRPYVGAGVHVVRSTQRGFGSTNKSGFQAFGGGELTFASVPRFALSADVGYRRSPAPFAGFELGGLGFSVAGHWYLR